MSEHLVSSGHMLQLIAPPNNIEGTHTHTPPIHKVNKCNLFIFMFVNEDKYRQNTVADIIVICVPNWGHQKGPLPNAFWDLETLRN